MNCSQWQCIWILRSTYFDQWPFISINVSAIVGIFRRRGRHIRWPFNKAVIKRPVVKEMIQTWCKEMKDYLFNSPAKVNSQVNHSIVIEITQTSSPLPRLWDFNCYILAHPSFKSCFQLLNLSTFECNGFNYNLQGGIPKQQTNWFNWR